MSKLQDVYGVKGRDRQGVNIGLVGMSGAYLGGLLVGRMPEL